MSSVIDAAEQFAKPHERELKRLRAEADALVNSRIEGRLKIAPEAYPSYIREYRQAILENLKTWPRPAEGSTGFFPMGPAHAAGFSFAAALLDDARMVETVLDMPHHPDDPVEELEDVND